MIEIPTARRSLAGSWQERIQQQSFFAQAILVGTLLMGLAVLIDKVFD